VGSYDDYGYYEREQAIAEFVEQSLRDTSLGNTKDYLGRFGDAIEARVTARLSESRELFDLRHFGPAVVAATTAIELIIRFMLVRPLVQGAFLSDEWASILAKRVATGRTAEDRAILPALLRQWSVDIESVVLRDGSRLWDTITKRVLPVRHKVVHDGSTASETEAAQSIECANSLMDNVVRVMAVNLGFTLDHTGRWSEIHREQTREDGGKTEWSSSYMPESPFNEP